MSFHLHHPSLSLNGKKKGPKKFRSAADAQRSRELEESWQQLLKSHGVQTFQAQRNRAMSAKPLTYKLSPPAGREIQNIPSRDTGITGAVTSKQSQQYTGSKIIGIGTMHKSNAVPIFSNDDAKAISSMRR